MNENTITKLTQAEIISNFEQQLGEYLEACTEPSPGSSVQPGRMFARYQQWCWDTKQRAMSINMFAVLMRERGIRRTKSYGKPYWRDVRIIEDGEEV